MGAFVDGVGGHGDVGKGRGEAGVLDVGAVLADGHPASRHREEAAHPEPGGEEPNMQLLHAGI